MADTRGEVLVTMGRPYLLKLSGHSPRGALLFAQIGPHGARWKGTRASLAKAAKEDESRSSE